MFRSETMRRIAPRLAAGLVGAALCACAHGVAHDGRAGAPEARGGGASGAPIRELPDWELPDWELPDAEDASAYAPPLDWAVDPRCTRRNESLHVLLRCGR